MLPPIVTAFLWLWLYNADSGLLNALLHLVHLPGGLWLENQGTALPALVVVATWGAAGSTMLIYLAALQVDYSSVAVVSQDWRSGPVTIVEEADEVTLATSAATAHLSLGPLRIGFTDYTGRAFALDHPELGMGWFTVSGEAPVVDLANQSGTLGMPVRVYKQHMAGEHYFGCGDTGELDKTGSQQIFWNIDPPRGHTSLQNNLYVSIAAAFHYFAFWLRGYTTPCPALDGR